MIKGKDLPHTTPSRSVTLMTPSPNSDPQMPSCSLSLACHLCLLFLTPPPSKDSSGKLSFCLRSHLLLPFGESSSLLDLLISETFSALIQICLIPPCKHQWFSSVPGHSPHRFDECIMITSLVLIPAFLLPHVQRAFYPAFTHTFFSGRQPPRALDIQAPLR
jgi:hypothetical protein